MEASEFGSAANDSIRTGLNAVGLNKLDLLDFDACVMGETNVLNAVGANADQIVASTENETANGRLSDAQNIVPIIKSVLDNPSMTPKQLGAEIIHQADIGANGGEAAADPDSRKYAATPALAQYDAAKMPALSRSINDLGTALDTAWADNQNHAAIRQAIAKAPRSASWGTPREDYAPLDVRDVKTVAENIMQEINSGKLSDADHHIATAVQSVLDNRKQLVENYHGESKGGYDKQGGISMFAPGDGAFNAQARADKVDNLGKILALTADKDNQGIGAKAHVVESVNKEIKAATNMLGSGNAPFKPLQAAVAKIDAAKDDVEYKAAVEQLTGAVGKFAAGNDGQNLGAMYLRHAQNATEILLRSQEDPSLPKWNKLLADLDDSAPEVYSK